MAAARAARAAARITCRPSLLHAVLSPFPSCNNALNQSPPPSSTGAPSSVLFSSNHRAFASGAHPAFFEIYNRQRQLVPLNHMVPDVAADAWVAPNAILIGGVTVEDTASVWYGAVLRADLNLITVGSGSNIQDKVIISTVAPSPGGLPTEVRIGRSVTVGQGSVLQSCEVEDEAIIGQRSIVPQGCLVEKNSVLADGTVLSEGQLIPSGQLWAGNPAQFVRELTADEKAAIAGVANADKVIAGDHASEFLPFSPAYIDKENLMESLKAARAAKAKKSA